MVAVIGDCNGLLTGDLTCPDSGSILHKGHCYVIVPFPEIVWTAADHICHSIQVKLPTTMTKCRQQCINSNAWLQRNTGRIGPAEQQRGTWLHNKSITFQWSIQRHGLLLDRQIKSVPAKRITFRWVCLKHNARSIDRTSSIRKSYEMCSLLMFSLRLQLRTDSRGLASSMSLNPPLANQQQCFNGILPITWRLHLRKDIQK